MSVRCMSDTSWGRVVLRSLMQSVRIWIRRSMRKQSLGKQHRRPLPLRCIEQTNVILVKTTAYISNKTRQSLKNHMDSPILRANSAVRAIRLLSGCNWELDPKLGLSLYRSLVQPILQHSAFSTINQILSHESNVLCGGSGKEMIGPHKIYSHSYHFDPNKRNPYTV